MKEIYEPYHGEDHKYKPKILDLLLKKENETNKITKEENNK